MRVINAYRFRIYPTPEQEKELFRTIGCTRKMYNLVLSTYEDIYDAYTNEDISKDMYQALKKSINPSIYKEEYPYLSEVDSTALKYAKKHCDQAYNNFFKGTAEFPKHKKRSTATWSYTTCRASKNARNVRLGKHGRLVLPKITGTIKTVVTRNPVGTLVAATITKERTNTWFVSLQYEHHTASPIHPATLDALSSPVGIDMGIMHIATTSDGETLENPKYAKQARQRIAKLDRQLARKRTQAQQDGKHLSECKNYQKTKVKRAKAYAKARNQRQDTLHKYTTQLVKTHDFITVEDLSAHNLMHNHHLAFAVADVSWGTFRTMLQCKMERKGGILQVIDRYSPSPQLCSRWGRKTGPQGYEGLHVREWECPDCGALHDRDVNAATNILTRGLTEFYAAGTAVEVTHPQPQPSQPPAIISADSILGKDMGAGNDSVRYLPQNLLPQPTQDR